MPSKNQQGMGWVHIGTGGCDLGDCSEDCGHDFYILSGFFFPVGIMAAADPWKSWLSCVWMGAEACPSLVSLL